MFKYSQTSCIFLSLFDTKKKIELKPFNPEDAFVNSVDPDETAHNEPSHQDLPVCHSVLGLQLSPFWQQWMFPKCRAGSNLASILYKSKVGRYRPVSYPDGPITARYRFMQNAYWVKVLRVKRLNA